MDAFLPITPYPRKVELKEGFSTAEAHYTVDKTLEEEEYCIDITKRSVYVTYSTDKGRFYADLTLSQLRSQFPDGLPVAVISDKPKLRWRGFMLDVGRYFYPTEDVKQIIALAAALKFNVFHLHLTEDQGWRVQIDKYPLLTEVGAYRSKTNRDKTPHGGFYTKDELKDIVAFAHANNMIVVPEIDCPAHIRSALAAYPHLGCFNRKLTVAEHFGIKFDILCAGKQSSYDFLYAVFDEILEIFTDGYLHLGADEALKERWKFCPDCKRTMEEQGITDLDDLQTYFINRIYTEYLQPKGVKAIIWVLTVPPKGLHPEIIAQQYHTQTSKAVCDGGRRVVNSCSQWYYIDFPHAVTPLDKCYAGVPEDVDGATVDAAEVCLWTEYVPNLAVAKYQSMPRALAVADRFWGDGTDYECFKSRAEAYYAAHPDKDYCPIADAVPSGKPAARQKRALSMRWRDWEGLNIKIDNFLFGLKRILKRGKK